MADIEQPQILKDFLIVYPEFSPLYTTQEGIDSFLSIVAKLQCIYPEFQNIETCKNKYPFFMLVAHTIVMDGKSSSIGIYPLKGLLSNSAVGNASVGYQQTPYSTDSFSYYLSLSKYGKEYLAWLQRQAGLVYVN